MAVILLPGVNIVTASVDATWAELGFTSTNVIEVYSTIDGNPVSWRPNRTINTLAAGGVIAFQGYQVNAKLTRDVSNYFISNANGNGVVTLS